MSLKRSAPVLSPTVYGCWGNKTSVGAQSERGGLSSAVDSNIYHSRVEKY